MLHIMIINERLCHLIIGVLDPVQPRDLHLTWNIQKAFGDVQEQKGTDGSTVCVEGGGGGEIQPVYDGCVSCQRFTHSLTSNFARTWRKPMVCEPHENHEGAVLPCSCPLHLYAFNNQFHYKIFHRILS